MTQDEKKEAILRLNSEQKKVLRQLNRLAKLKPCKRSVNSFKRKVKQVQLALRLHLIQKDKMLIASVPIPRFKEGDKINSGIAQIKENGNESILPKRFL